MGIDIVLFVERRRGNQWEPVDPPRAGDTLAWKFDRCKEAFGFLCGNLGPESWVKSISHNRGLPNNASKQVREEFRERYTPPYSWLSLPELLSADLDYLVKEESLVDVPGFREWLQRGRPSNPCNVILPRPAYTVSNEEMRRVSEWWKPGGDVYCTEVSWTQPLRDSVQPLLNFMEQLKREGNPDDLRIIFGFS